MCQQGLRIRIGNLAPVYFSIVNNSATFTQALRQCFTPTDAAYDGDAFAAHLLLPLYPAFMELLAYQTADKAIEETRVETRV